MKLVEWEFSKGDYWLDFLRIKKNRDSWQKVTIPHTWNAKDYLTKGSDSYHGVSTYITYLDSISKEDNKRHFIRFEGVSISAEVISTRFS